MQVENSWVKKEEREEARYDMRYYLRDSNLVVNLIVITIAWSAFSFNYYLSSFQLKYLPGNVNMNAFVMYIGELFSMLAAGWLFNKFSVRYNLAFFYFVALVFGLATL